MPTTRLGITVYSVQTVRENHAYGSILAQAPLDFGAAAALLDISVPPSIPKNATVTSAKIWVAQYGAWAGTNILTVLRHLAAFTYKVTWDNRPAATTTDSRSKTNSPAGTWWSFDVTGDLQAIIAGTRKDYGWRLSTDSTVQQKIRTHRAATLRPYLELTYQVPSKVPTSLAPQGGAVSVEAPVLTFTCGDDTTAVQVQVDPFSDGVAPEFDSGEVAATAGVLDLADTAYAGLADGDATTWRARAKSASGWGAWSAWVSFSREDLETAALTSPIATPADGTPPFEWTFTGTQTAWQATLLSDDGKILDDSGLVSGADTAWTPSKGLKATGDSGIARVRLYDDVLRIATSGVPIYAEDTVDFTVTFDGTVDPLDTLVAATVANVPGVVLTGTRAVGVPDEVAIFRDGIQVARMPGTDAFTGTDFAYTDYSAPLGVEVTYRVAPIENSAVASGGPTDTAMASSAGVWLINPATGVMAVLWDRDEGSWDAADLATVHQPIAEDAPPVRRRLRRGVLAGTMSGRIVDGLGFDAEDTLAALEEFAEADAGTLYRLIAGSLNAEVIAGDFLVTPTPVNGVDRGQFTFWAS